MLEKQGEKLSQEDIKSLVSTWLSGRSYPLGQVMIVPPDFTRFHSFAGAITCEAWAWLNNKGIDVKILPALGTHVPMSEPEIEKMFPGIPKSIFIDHNWQEGLKSFGEVPSSFIEEVSEGKLHYSIGIEINAQLTEPLDLILSIGQVVPHEVVGMANHNKNILVGTGGSATIGKTHYLGGVYGMERIMGRADSPVRRTFDWAEENKLAHLPIAYIQTVASRDPSGELSLKGMYLGEGKEPFNKACEQAIQCNLDLLDKPFKKVVVFLNKDEFRSTWLGNKAIYRTRMALADDAELIVLAPGLREFGEDKEVDRLIRKYGYHGTPYTLKAVEENEDLAASLGSAAHLIHGSSEGRFKITYAPGPKITQAEIEGVGFEYTDLEPLMQRLDPLNRSDGFYEDPELGSYYFIGNPATGLWALKESFNQPC